MGKLGKIEKIAIKDLIPYANNAKLHSENQITKIADSIQEFGFVNPVLIDKDFNIIAGHGRVMAAKKLQMKEVPCLFVEGLTEAQRKAYIIADNKLTELGGWDKELVVSELSLLENIDFNIDLTGFSLDDLNQFEDDITKPYGSERDRTNDAYNLELAHVSDLTNSFWQMPILNKCNYVPEKLVGFNYAKTCKNKKCGIHFFIDDYQFERIWNDPEKYIEILNEYDCILTPDFSLYMDMPMPTKIWNIYRSRQIGSYYQNLGFNVIPTISWAEEDTFKFCFEGIEEGSTVAVSTIGVKNDEKLYNVWKAGMDEMIKRIKPSCILVYGGEIEYDYQNIQVKFYKNEVTSKWKRGVGK